MEASKPSRQKHYNNNGIAKQINEIVKLIIQLPEKFHQKVIEELLKGIELNQN